MTKRPDIPKPVERIVLTKSRRRCCLCFWLQGLDEVQKGQIAHLDNDPTNNAEDNLAFLCFDHHDEYDSSTRQSKGLELGEVKHWRTELYKEMMYRYRHETLYPELKLRFVKLSRGDPIIYLAHRQAHFTVENIGQTSASNIKICFQLVNGVMAQKPGEGWIVEKTMNIFEPDGKVGFVGNLLETGELLLPSHTIDFFGLKISDEHFPPGSELKLNYQIDAEGMPPITGTVVIPVTDGWSTQKQVND